MAASGLHPLLCFPNFSSNASVATIYAGTSGWSYATWKPRFYPPKLASKKFLEYFATRLNSVEVNYTYRVFASEKLLRSWLDQTPPHFRFSFKAHQLITHIKRLRDAADVTERFYRSLQPMHEAGRLGTVLFQLPPFLKCDLALLGEFLSHQPAAMHKTFEFRHESWFTDDVFALLRQHDAALCVAESEKLVVPDVQTASFAYYRLRKPEYSEDERRNLAARFAGLREKGSDVFAYFKHEETPEGALYAEEMLKR